jgi:hypothetical protein
MAVTPSKLGRCATACSPGDRCRVGADDDDVPVGGGAWVSDAVGDVAGSTPNATCICPPACDTALAWDACTPDDDNVDAGAAGAVVEVTTLYANTPVKANSTPKAFKAVMVFWKIRTEATITTSRRTLCDGKKDDHEVRGENR